MSSQSLNSGDRRAGRGAWLLRNIEDLQVYGVHSLLWHKVKNVFTAPLVDQVARVLNLSSQLDPDEMQRLGREASVIDILGIKDEEIWLVQTMRGTKLIDSGTNGIKFAGQTLFKTNVFRDPVFKGDALMTLFQADYVMRKAFPNARVRTLCLVLHKLKPDFALYDIAMPKNRPRAIVLTDPNLRTHSLHFEKQIQEDHESLWRLPARLDDELFRGLPPCRGGRALSMLATMAREQLETEGLLLWKERKFIDRMKEDFGYEITRDKVRHDLVDRLVGQGSMRKWANLYCLTVRGIVRYLYCLAKYTTRAPADPSHLLNTCTIHRQRMIRLGCL